MKRYVYFSLLCAVLLCFVNGIAFAQENSDCDRVYQTAIRFVVDTPVAHPFTINAEGGQVIFSRGNLQYCPLRDEWRFALRQFDRCGNGKQAVMPVGSEKFATANYGITTVFWDSAEYKVPCNNLLVGKRYGGWIDLFPWGTSGHGRRVGDEYTLYFYPYELNHATINATYNTYGYGPSYNGGHGEGALTNDIDAKSGTNQYFDWGYGNVIREYSGCTHTKEGVLLHAHDSTMYRPAVWRTLTAEEWQYLLINRIVANNDSAFSYVRLKYGDNATDTVSGVLIYPDDFSFANASVARIPFGAYAVRQIDLETYLALEQEGVIFLPAARIYELKEDGSIIMGEAYVGTRLHYWSATANNASNANNAYFDIVNRTISPSTNNNSRNYGFPVRLVQNYTPAQKTAPAPTPDPAPTPTPAPAPPRKEGFFSVSEKKQ